MRFNLRAACYVSMVDGLDTIKQTRLYYSDQLKCSLEYLFD